MQQILKQKLNKGIILKTAIIFLTFYFISLLLWIQVKDIYSYGVINIVSHLIPLVKDVELHELTLKGADTIKATFKPLRHNAGLLSIHINTSSYSSNVPLTLGIMAALYPFVRRRAYAGGLALLFGTHIITIFFNEAAQLTSALARKGFDSSGAIRIAFYQFLRIFTADMVGQFMPFLAGFYMFVRFRK